VPHLPDGDDFTRPLKVLRRRLNGVYREDLGFSGPTRRYVLMVVMLVGLASVPTLAVLSTGSSEITGEGRTGAMEVPFLPPPATGPVLPAPFPPASGMPPPPARTTQGYGESPSPVVSTGPVTSSGTRAGEAPRGSADPAPGTSSGAARGGSPRVPARRVLAEPARASGGGARHAVPDPVRVSDRGSAGPSRTSGAGRWDGPPLARSPIPAVPGLPVVPEEGASPEPVPPYDFPTVPDLPDIPDENDQSVDDDNDDPGNPGEPHKPDHPGKRHCDERTTMHERFSRRHPDHAATTQRPAGDPPRRDDRSTVHDRRSADRPRLSRRSAVAERPYNVRPSRILEQSHSDGNLNVVRRLLADSNSEENRRANRPYRGMHRAEHTNYPEERNASYDRSTRVGRHHADPDARYINRR
jgi:hypothetical protein